jgi:hypothetical protein
MSPLKVHNGNATNLPGIRAVKLLTEGDVGYDETPFHVMTEEGVKRIRLVDTDSEWALRIWCVPSLGVVKAWGDDEAEEEEYTLFLFLRFHDPIFVQYGEDLELELPERSITHKTGTNLTVEVYDFDAYDDGQVGYNCGARPLGLYQCPVHGVEYTKTRAEYRAGAKTCQVITHYTCSLSGGIYEDPEHVCPVGEELEPVYCETELEYSKTEPFGKIRSWGLSTWSCNGTQHKCKTYQYDCLGNQIQPTYALRDGYAGSLTASFSSEWHDFWGCDFEGHEDIMLSQEEYDELPGTPGEKLCPKATECGLWLVEKQMRWVVQIRPEQHVYPDEIITLTAGIGHSSSPKTYLCAEYDSGEEEWNYTIPNLSDKTSTFPYAEGVMEIRPWEEIL